MMHSLFFPALSLFTLSSPSLTILFTNLRICLSQQRLITKKAGTLSLMLPDGCQDLDHMTSLDLGTNEICSAALPV
jgi:Leucine-rich repeat (LRR) protein